MKLNPPGTRLLSSREFNAPLVRGITIYPENPLQFDFIVDRGDGKVIDDNLEPEALRMMKYFFASLTVPDEEMWVNLSPHEKDRIATPSLSQTELGRDMLAQDYQLKQYAASLLYPQEALGKKFWDQVYQLTQEKFGTTQVPLDLANRVWIVPEGAVVYEHGNSAFVVESHLKVMLEEDYLSAQNQPRRGQTNGVDSTTQPIISQIMREIIVPAIEAEVNKGENFTNLRQIYHAMILAAWYKKNLMQSLLSQVYVNKGKTRGVDVDDKAVSQKIYEQYLSALKKGVYNFIHEDMDPVSQNKIPRKYFSGGLTGVKDITTVRSIANRPLPSVLSSPVTGSLVSYTFQGVEVTPQNVSSPNSFSQKYRDALNASSPIVSKREYTMPWAFPSARYDRGNREPEWHMAETTGAVILGLQQQYKEGIPVEEAVAKSVQVLKEYGLTVEKGEALEIINGLRLRGLIVGNKEGAIKLGREEKIFLKSANQEIALWSRDYQFIRQEIDNAIKKNWKEFFDLIEQYEQILNESPYPVESRYPVLWAINTLPLELKNQITEQLIARGDWYRKGLVDSILLMLDLEKAKANWLSLQAPQLVGRNVYIVSPEISLFEGGLGRVETYEGMAAHELGAAVTFVEPKYRLNKDKKTGQYVAVDYNNTPIPLRNLRKIDKIFTTYVNWEVVEFEVEVGTDDKGIQHVLIQDRVKPDGKAKFINVQYLHNVPDLSPVSEEDFREFFSKASLEALRYLEMERRKDLKADYKAPLINPNDGQSLVMDTWRLIFYGEKEKIVKDKNTSDEDVTATYEIFRDAVFSGKTHTYRNRGTIDNLGWGIKRVRDAGVPEGWIWLFLRKDNGGKILVDWTSPGLRTGDGKQAVSAIHAYEVNPYDPRERLMATTNGDKRDLTTVYFQQVLTSVGNTDYENATPEEVAAAKAKAKESMQLNPRQFVLAYLGRLVPEKAGDKTLFTPENIELMVKAGIQVVIYGNEQPYWDSQEIANRFRNLAERIQRLKAEKPQEYQGNFILKTRYDFDDQRKILAAADVQVLPSTRHTGAAEITEYNGPATYTLVLGPAYWEGVISRLGPPVNWERDTGSTIIPINDSPEGYREVVMKANSKFKEGKLSAMQVIAGRTSLSTKAEINSADSLRYWSGLFDQARASRRLKPRVAGEVEIQGIEVKTYKDGKENLVKRDGNRFYKEQHKPNGERVLIEVSIALEAWDVVNGGQKGMVPFDMVEARFVGEYGIVVPLRLKQREDTRVIMFAQLPAGIALPLKGRIEATSGLWNSVQEIAIDMVEQPASSPLEAIQANKEAPGGIDFNPALLNLQIKRDRAGVPLPAVQQPIGNMNIDGFIPVIINVTPMLNLPFLLGVDSPGQSQPQAQARKKISLN